MKFPVFKIGDKTRCIRSPRRDMPEGSVFTVARVEGRYVKFEEQRSNTSYKWPGWLANRFVLAYNEKGWI